jgi:hypothetical protein
MTRNGAAQPGRSEDAEDPAAHRVRATEPSLDLEEVLKDMRRRGKV